MFGNSASVCPSTNSDDQRFYARNAEDFEFTDNEGLRHKPDSDMEGDKEECLDLEVGDVDGNREVQLDATGRRENVDGETAKLEITRKRRRDPTSWKRNVQKKLRMEGKPYCTQKGKPKRGRGLKDIECHCHYKCTQIFSKEQRQNILERFLQLDTQQLRWNFISKQVVCIPKKRCYSANNDRRTYTYV